MTATLPTPPPPPAPPTPPPSPPRLSRRVRTAWKAAASIAAVAVLLWGASTAVTQLAHEERTTTTELDAAGITTLDVAIDSGSLTVVGTEGDRIVVTARISDGLRSTSERQEVDGDRLVLRGGCPAFLSNFCNVDYTVEVPERIAVKARLDNDGARATGVRGDLDLRSDNGRIEVRGSGEGAVVLRSSNGNVVATDLRAAEVDAHSDNGRVQLSFLEPPTTVEGTSSNGDVTVEVPDDGAAYVVDTGSANGSSATGVRTDPESTRRIRVASDNGDVLVSYRAD
jgi:hypothetical protein